MDRPSPEHFGLTAEEVDRVETRHDTRCRRLVSAPLLLALAAAFVGFLAVCRECNVLVAFLLALGLVAVFTTVLGIVSAILVFALYPVVARRVSPGYRAVARFRAALARYEALQ